MDHEKEWLDAKNVLCIRLDSLGDVLMTTPAMRALKENHPERRITLLTSPAGAKVASLINEVDETIIYEAPWMKATAAPANSTKELEMISALKEGRFDAAIIFTVFTQNPLPAAMLAFMAEIPLRLAHCRENPYYLLTNWVAETDHLNQVDDIRHEVRRQLDLIASIGDTTADEHISLQVSPETVAVAREILKESQLDISRPWLILHPGASAPSRRYPPESFAKVAHTLACVHGFQILFTGVESEVELIEGIRADMQADSFSVAGRLNLEQFSAVISLAPLVVSNNTSPVHIAAALGVPIVDLYALTNPQHTPWKVPHRVLYQDVPCKFCYKSICPMGHHNCLRQVSPESVVEAALSLIQ
jgi:lipopolysaccharide heptosyltransferase II